MNDLVNLLFKHGALVGTNSARLIASAADRGDEYLVDLLLSHGANASRLGVGNWVLHKALAKKLISAGANVNRPYAKWIGLCCTGNSGHRENIDLARAYLEAGADVRAIYKGKTAMECATKAGFSKIVEALHEYGG